MISPGLDIRPLSASPGYRIEISGIDLRKPIASDVARKVVEAFYEDGLLLVRDQELSPHDQMRFLGLFGEVASGGEIHEGAVPGVGYISNTMDGGARPLGELTFHFDTAYDPRPLSVLSLFAIEAVPPNCGGETQFASLRVAYDNLPEGLKGRIESMRAVHCIEPRDDVRERLHFRVRESALRPEEPRTTHPVAMVHPKTGKRSLFLSLRNTDRILGLPPDESESLIEELLSYAYTPENVYTHAWKAGDLVVWDNLALQHARRNFDPKHRRHLQKVRVR